MSAKVIRADGRVEDLGQIAEWKPPLPVRVGRAIQRFLERVDATLTAIKRWFERFRP